MNKKSFLELIKLGYPLVLTSSTFIIMLFMDRLFLSWYSQETIAASVASSTCSFTISAFFIGVANYVQTFISQYYGAKRYKEIGKIIWQGMYFAVFAGIILISLLPITREIFTVSNHSAKVQELEKLYFTILQFGMVISIIGDVAMGFLSGRGKTKTVFLVVLSGVLVNGLLDYVMIFGYLGFPRLGIEGAGIATVCAISVRSILFICVLLRKKYREKYNILKSYKFDKQLFKRLLRFGAPSGLQMLLDMGSFTIFVLLLGRLGDLELAVSNIALTINMICFIPIGGIHWATSILASQYIGKNDYVGASRITFNSFVITACYVGLIAFTFLIIPDFYLRLFEQNNGTDFGKILEMGRMMLTLLGIYTFVNAIQFIFAATLKGAGDTRFTMMVSILSSWIFFVPMSYIFVEVLKLDIFWCWSLLATYVILKGIIIIIRYISGRWKHFDVIGREEEIKLIA